MKQTGRATELKFSVPASTIEGVLECARMHLDPDPHADPSRGDGYAIHTLYFDTEALDVYHRQGPYRNAKYRIRRYGGEEALFLERKSKPQGRVRKHRTQIPLTELAFLESEEIQEDWNGLWFRHRLQTLHLRPVCQLSYERVARVGVIDGQPVRFTLDRHVTCVPRGEIGPPERREGLSVLPDEEGIVEMKFTSEMPRAFQNLVHGLGLSPTSLSKFRLGIRALGLTPGCASPVMNGTEQHASEPVTPRQPDYL